MVGKLGTSTISLDELFKEFSINQKIASIAELRKIVQIYKKQNVKVGFTNGCFDILHMGHLKYLMESKNFAISLLLQLIVMSQ